MSRYWGLFRQIIERGTQIADAMEADMTQIKWNRDEWNTDHLSDSDVQDDTTLLDPPYEDEGEAVEGWLVNLADEVDLLRSLLKRMNVVVWPTGMTIGDTERWQYQVKSSINVLTREQADAVRRAQVATVPHKE